VTTSPEPDTTRRMAKTNGKAKAKKGKPAKTASNGRDPKTQRFMPGHPGGPGRPRGLDIRTAVRDAAEKSGVCLQEAAANVMEAMRKQAEDGDVQAAKLWMDRLGGLLKQELDVQATSTVFMPDDARAVLGRMMGTDVAQDALLDECERRTDGA